MVTGSRFAFPDPYRSLKWVGDEDLSFLSLLPLEALFFLRLCLPARLRPGSRQRSDVVFVRFSCVVSPGPGPRAWCAAWLFPFWALRLIPSGGHTACAASRIASRTWTQFS